MGEVRTSIGLQDNFTGILMNVINAVNLSIFSMEQIQSVMSEPIDTAGIQGMRDQINEATIATQELIAAMNSVEAPAVGTPAVPVQLPIGNEWQSFEGLEVFTNTGLERTEQEITSVNNLLRQLGDTQYGITQQANESEVLSPQAAYDVQMTENRIQELMEMIRRVEENPLNLGTDQANTGFERLRGQLSQMMGRQEALGQAMGAMDPEAINAAYLELSQNISDVERSVRDSFSSLPPVEIPVTWEAGTQEVFTGRGMERFEMEAQSANRALNALSQTQAEIAARAAGADIFPSDMVTDMSAMRNRLQAIQSQIQLIEGNPMNMGTDIANAQLERLRGQLNQAAREQEAMNQAIEGMDIQAANDAYLRLSQTIGGTERYIRDNVDEQGRFNQEVSQGTQEASGLAQAIKGAVAAYATLQTAGKVINLSDTYTQTEARLSMLVDIDGGGSVEQFQDMIYLSAERARGSYQETADAVAKLGLMAGNAFSGNEEIIAFTEQLNKQFVIAGTEASGIQAAMLQLTQAMGSGVLRGEEYNSILEQAPNIVQNIGKYIEGNEEVLNSVAASMGMRAEELAGNVQGNLKDIASEGLLSAEVVKAAMFWSADETNEKFESMPKTFEQVWTSFQNTALMAFQPVLARLNDVANSQLFQGFVTDAVGALTIVAGITLGIFDALGAGGAVLVDNWSWISPILYGAAAAMAAYLAVLVAYNTAQAISNGIKAAAAFQETVHSAAMAMSAGQTFLATAAQYGLNAALLACPLTWVVVGVIALVAAFYAGVAAVNHFAGTSVSATGIIAGVFAVLGAHIANSFVVPTWNGFASLANFVGNVFNDPVAAVKVLFYDMCLIVVGYIQNLAASIETLLNKIPGVTVDITSGLDHFYSGLERAQQAVKDESGWVEYVQKMDYIDYRDAASAGYSFGQGIADSVAGFDPSSLFNTNIPDAGDYADLSNYGTGIVDTGLADIGSGVDDIAGNTGAIADAMDITDEELKYMRDLAEQETINRYTTAEIKIDQSGMRNTVSGGDDLTRLLAVLTDAVGEAVEMAAEGVHQ